MIKQKKVEKVENIEERFKHGRPGPRLSSVQERKLYWRGQRQEKKVCYQTQTASELSKVRTKQQ
jgi:hypothetical protein